MDFIKAKEYIQTLYEEKRIILGLERVRHLLELVGNPQDNYPSCIVTGTNGKGSTSVYLSSIIKACGYKVGTNLSPHVKDITERFLVNLEQISHDHFADITLTFKDVITTKWPERIEKPTFHELMTAMSFYLFAKEKVDYAVMEVGMGGRYDACNIAENKLSIFTPIHFDHCRYLGDSLRAISLEKAQIMKSGGAAVSAIQSPQVRATLGENARKFNTRLEYLNFRKFSQNDSTIFEPVNFRYCFDNSEIADIRLNQAATYQVYNASLSIFAAEKLAQSGILKGFNEKLNSETVRDGLSAVKSDHLPARLEILNREPLVVLDGGHNPHGIRTFMSELRNVKPGCRITLVIGFKEGKNYYDSLCYLDGNINQIIFTNFDNMQGTSPHALKSELIRIKPQNGQMIYSVDNPIDAIRIALENLPDRKNDVVAIVGSLYLAGEIKNSLESVKISDCGISDREPLKCSGYSL